MSVEQNLYYGHYFTVKSVEVKHWIEKHGCKNCDRESNNKFCSTCGEKIDDYEVLKKYEASILDMIEDLQASHDYGEFLADTGLGNDGSLICVLNYSGVYNQPSLGRVGEGEYLIPKSMLDNGVEFTLKWQYTVSQFLKDFRERYGDDSIKMDIGLLAWYS